MRPGDRHQRARRAEHALLAEVGRRRAVVTAANFSVALLLVARFVRELSRRTGPGWDAGVLDVHFAGKRDRPSGTARFLADQWRPERCERPEYEGGDADGPAPGGQEPEPGGREPVGPEGGVRAAPEVAAFRLGDAVSEHRLLAAGPGEHVEVVHRVADRTAFLPGILRAVRFAATAPPGHYHLEDVLAAPPA
ncbi:dihydrodipicolinate reductase C-terminal domain-containing protein [Streptomyces sp. M19]